MACLRNDFGPGLGEVFCFWLLKVVETVPLCFTFLIFFFIWKRLIPDFNMPYENMVSESLDAL